jgi:hypothetical protein
MDSSTVCSRAELLGGCGPGKAVFWGLQPGLNTGCRLSFFDVPVKKAKDILLPCGDVLVQHAMAIIPG